VGNAQNESIQGKPEVDISHNVYNEVEQKVREQLNASGNIFPGPIPSNIVESSALTTGKNDYASASVKLNPGFSFTATSGNNYVAAIGTGSAQGQEFRYNIRGWLTSINNGTLTDDGVTQTDPGALFGESITYSETSPLTGAAPQYNGNISGITWRNKIEQTGKPGVTTGGQGYAFTYDNVNRQTQTAYYTQTGSTFTKNSANALTENVTGYDEMGNIQGLQRKDKTGSLINNLTYTYQPLGNQLANISDAGSQNITGTFTYDGNGNMTSDSRKGITITYNYLDLPDTVKQGASKLVFTYDAAGNKLYKQLITSGTIVSQRHYVEDAEVTATSSIAFDGKIESIAMDEGRIINPASVNSRYEYYLQDHLFNNRVTFRPVTDSTLNLGMVQNYYPFGENMGDKTMNYSISPTNNYKYSDNEWQPELNLNTYDFDSRHYDPILGRFLGIDALAEESEDWSPYNYVENSPMNLIDPDGMQPNNGNWMGVPFGSWGGSGGSLFSQFGGWGGSAISGASGLVGGLSAFNINKPITKTNWSGLGKVQGNVLSTFSPTPRDHTASGPMPKNSQTFSHISYELSKQIEFASQPKKKIGRPLPMGSINPVTGHRIGSGSIETSDPIFDVLSGASTWGIGAVEEMSAMEGANAAGDVAVHGNSLKSVRPTWGYKLYSQDGKFLKNGITSNSIPESRYTRGFMEDKFMKIEPLFPNRKAAWDWEYLQNKIQRGSLNKNMH